MSFKDTRVLSYRIAECNRIKNKYPNKIPVICENEPGGDLPTLDKNKYLIDWDLTMGQLVHVIKRRLSVPPEKAIYLLADNTFIPANSELVSAVYERHRDMEDGFLYMLVCSENFFG